MSYSTQAESTRLRRLLGKLRQFRVPRPFSIRLGRDDDYLTWFENAPSPILRTPVATWQSCGIAATMMGPQTFRFFDVERVISDSRGWHWKPWGENWLHNLHSFDDLVASDAGTRRNWHRAFITSWISANATGRGVGWQQASLARRVSNWIRWDLACHQLNEVAKRSLVVQVRQLRRDARRQDVLYPAKRAKALVFAGAFIVGQEADGWRRAGLDLILELIRPPAGKPRPVTRHAVLSALVEDLLDIVQLAYVYPGLLPASAIDAIRDYAVEVLTNEAAAAPPHLDVVDGQPFFYAEPSWAALHHYANRLHD